MDDRLGRFFDDYRQRTIVRSLRYTESTIKPTLSDALANTAPKGKREENPVAPLPLDSAVIDHRLAYLCRRRHVVLVVCQSPLIIHVPLVTRDVTVDVPNRACGKSGRTRRDSSTVKKKNNR